MLLFNLMSLILIFICDNNFKSKHHVSPIWHPMDAPLAKSCTTDLQSKQDKGKGAAKAAGS